MSKLTKAYRDPVGFLLDSRLGILRGLGNSIEQRRREAFLKLAKEAEEDLPVCVIMTAYNTGPYIEAAVESVLAQTYKNITLHIIDDASSDDTPNILARLSAKDDRIKTFRSPTNHGTYWSKNWCLKNATTPLVTFHDSDDVSEPHRIQQQVGALLLNKNTVATTARWRRVMQDGTAVTIDGKQERTAAITLMLWRERALKTLGFFDSVRISADTEYLGRIRHICGRKAVYHGKEALYTGLIRDDSLTRGENSGFEWTGTKGRQDRQLTGDRLTYHNSFKAWHFGLGEQKTLGPIPYPMKDRPFPAPAALIKGGDDQNLDQVKPL